MSLIKNPQSIIFIHSLWTLAWPSITWSDEVKIVDFSFMAYSWASLIFYFPVSIFPTHNFLILYFIFLSALLSTFSGNSSESPYYPLGSEASIRPFSPKFISEEISSNYEPILVSNRGLAVTPVIGKYTLASVYAVLIL